ncbi:MAG: hypothetical protein MO852_17275 [Candidatus Devosia euplotis]|nr:hypothetical protein [Candidatus Devosia euplotis]
MSTPAALADLRRLLVEEMKPQSGWRVVQPLVERLAQFDAAAAATAVVPHLLTAFGSWNSEEMTGEGGQAPLAAVKFGWTAEDEAEMADGEAREAGAFGYGACGEQGGHVLIPRPEYQLSEPRFDYCGGIPLNSIMEFCCDDYDEDTEDVETHYSDFLALYVCEVLHHATAEAISSEPFSEVNKRDDLCFLAGRHDRFPALAYRWTR